MLEGLFKTEGRKAFDIHAICCHSIIVLLHFSVKFYYIYEWSVAFIALKTYDIYGWYCI